MIQRIITALVLIPLVLLLILWAPALVLTVVAGIVALLATREFLSLMRHYGIEPFSAATYIFVGIFFAVMAGIAADKDDSFHLNYLFMVLYTGLFAGIAPFVFLTVGLKRERLGSIYPAAAAAVFAFTYIAIPMALLVSIGMPPQGSFYVIYLMLVVWSGDIFAYFVGKSLGRHKMSPHVSPKKTWEGAVASLLASVGFGTLFLHNSLRLGHWLTLHHLRPDASLWNPSELKIWKMVLLSTLLNVAAQLGDLVESAIKRGANVKDSGSILPGHGGMLDRIDALLFAAPVLWCFPMVLDWLR